VTPASSLTVFGADMDYVISDVLLAYVATISTLYDMVHATER
jgi:hypothetical protein